MADDEMHLNDETGEDLPADVQRKQPSELKDDGLYLQFKQWYLDDDAHSAPWRENAKTEFDFVACDQWPEKTVKTLEGENRMPLTFNYTGPFIEAVAGLEIGTRHEVAFVPRNIEPGDIIANEVVSATSKWMGDNCNAEDEQSEAFKDTVICGMGWTETRMAYDDDDPDGKYIEEKLDVMEMRWDCSARKKNLTDARRVWRVREMGLDEARDMFPDAADADLNATWAIGYDVGLPKSDEERRLKLENSHPADPKNRVTIVQVQWIERECYYRVAMQDGLEEMSEEDWKARQIMAKEAGVKLKAAKAYRKVRKQAFLGGKILGIGPCPDKERFTLQCITGKLHKTKGTFYGLVRLMRDPQVNANKWMSQALHIMNATAKGGILAERGVFKNIAEAQRTYASPQAITVVEDQAIQKGRIMQKPGAGLAAPYVQLTQMAVQAIPAVTGINLELLGMVDRTQPGVLEAQRKQSGMTILATLFDALRLYRYTNGKTRLYFIQNYMEDGKIIRVTGPVGMKAIKFIRDEHLGDYDVIVSDAPTSTNQKEQTWVMLMQMSQSPALAPLLAKPEIAVEALNYCPLPSKIVQLLQKGITTPNPQQDAQQQIAMAGAQADIAKKQADTDKTKADAEKSMAGATLDKAKTILTMADAMVKQQQAAAMPAIPAPILFPNFGRMGAPVDEFAVADSSPSGLPMPPEVPMAPPAARRRRADPGPVLDLFPESVSNQPPASGVI